MNEQISLNNQIINEEKDIASDDKKGMNSDDEIAWNKEFIYTLFIVISQTKLEFSLTLLRNMKLFLFPPENLIKLFKINSSVRSQKEIFELTFVKWSFFLKCCERKIFFLSIFLSQNSSEGKRSTKILYLRGQDSSSRNLGVANFQSIRL